MKQFATFDGKQFLNPIPTSVEPPSGYGYMLRRWLLGKEVRAPRQALGSFITDLATLAEPVPTDTLRIMWLGHSSVLLEMDGKRFLTDPVWGRAAPFRFAGPKRFFPAPLPVAALPPLMALFFPTTTTTTWMKTSCGRWRLRAYRFSARLGSGIICAGGE
jgi:hypothetical protein